MTPEQRLTLDCIERYFAENHIAPSIRELAKLRGYASTQAPHAQVQALIASGHLVRTSERTRNFAPAGRDLRDASTEQLRAELARREADRG